MEEDKILFIPVRLNSDKTDLGAIISIKDLGNYVALSNIFEQEKKSLIQTIVESPYTSPVLLDTLPS